MKNRWSQFSTRSLLGITLVVALLLPVSIHYYPKLVEYFSPAPIPPPASVTTKDLKPPPTNAAPDFEPGEEDFRSYDVEDWDVGRNRS